MTDIMIFVFLEIHSILSLISALETIKFFTLLNPLKYSPTLLMEALHIKLNIPELNSDLKARKELSLFAQLSSLLYILFFTSNYVYAACICKYCLMISLK